MDRFIDALILFGSQTDENLAALVTLQAACIQRVLDGGGEISTELSGTMNGQTYQFQISRSVDQLLPDVTEAITLIGNGGVSHQRASSFDYRFLQH